MSKHPGPIPVTQSELASCIIKNHDDVFGICMREFMKNHMIEEEDLKYFLTIVMDLEKIAIVEVKKPHKVLLISKQGDIEENADGTEFRITTKYGGYAFDKPDEYPETMKFLGYKRKE